MSRVSTIFGTCLWLLAIPAWCGHTLTADQENLLSSWLAQHTEYRAASDADCECADDIREMRIGYGDPRYAFPDYHPYRATGDFNGDGTMDFAAILIDQNVTDHKLVLVVFNGPITNQSAAPAFLKPGLDQRDVLFYFGPLKARPYRLWVGHFQTDCCFLLAPNRRTYTIRDL